MNFFQVLLLPFAGLYNLATRVRNHLYDSGYKTSFTFDRHTVCVGNLNVGGTGKTPMIEYLVRLISARYQTVTLSRGYGRKTKGFRIANEKDNATTMGDEPYQFYSKFDQIRVAVGEERAVAIPFILAELPDTEVILLDDAFQHRPVNPALSILLTDYSRPFYSDFLLPAGRLRESRHGAGRADCIVVTKCPEEVAEVEFSQIVSAIRKYNRTSPVYFTTTVYNRPVAVGSSNLISSNVILLAGIANPSDFFSYGEKHYSVARKLSFSDHHTFTVSEIDEILALSVDLDADVLTTEKDYMRLATGPGSVLLASNRLYYVPIEIVFLQNGKEFDAMIFDSFPDSRDGEI